MNVIKVINKVYPEIAKDYSCNAKVELYNNVYSRLSGIPEMSGEDNACAEYNWSKNEIYIYTDNMSNEEDIIKALIHECVHSNQNKELFLLNPYKIKYQISLIYYLYALGQFYASMV